MNLPSGFDTPVIIGKGAYGIVYRARQKQLDRQVVIKMIPFSRKDHRKRHFQEAVTQAQLHLPCFPQVYDVFIWKENVCIVMQWIRSLNLHRSISIYQNSRLCLAIAEGVIKAVSAIHTSGYAHRDIKPANILVSATEGVFLIDFGFSTKNDDRSKKSNSVRGTKGYIAPEILQKKDVSEIDYFRADCYALGVVLNNLLGYAHQFPLFKMLMDEDPVKRPAHAGEVYRLWKQQVTCESLEMFTAEIDLSIRQNLSKTLLDSACQLLKLQRFNEAYRLCLETLQETPDNPDALKMISTFSDNTEKKQFRSKLVICSAVAISMLIILFVYMFLSRSPRLISAEYAPLSFTDKQIFRTSNAVSGKDSLVRYRYHPSETPSLTAEVYFRTGTSDYLVYIDGKFIGESSRRKPPLQCNLPAGSYRVLITGTDGRFIKSEQLQVLPFGRIYIDTENSK